METKEYDLEDVSDFLHKEFGERGCTFLLHWTEGPPYLEYKNNKHFLVGLSLHCGPNTNMREAVKLLSNLKKGKNIELFFRVNL